MTLNPKPGRSSIRSFFFFLWKKIVMFVAVTEMEIDRVLLRGRRFVAEGFRFYSWSLKDFASLLKIL
jgi:hypothetical protein